MKELKEFTVEQLEQLASGDIFIFPQRGQIRDLAKIALAAKQAKGEPVCFIGKQMLIDLNEENRTCGRVWLAPRDEVDGNDRIPLYTTPPLNHTDQDGWIKCSESMPESSGEFSVYETLNNRVQHDYWVPDDCAALGIGFWNHYGTNVTHWMPLPAAPKPESE